MTAITDGTIRFKPNTSIIRFTKQMPYLVGFQGSNRFHSGGGYGNPEKLEVGTRADT